MRKIPTLFKRDPKDMRHVLPEVTPGCEWVLEGEGVATRKYDGTCVMLDGVLWWARREIKPGKPYPPGFQLVDFDSVTGKSVGWEPIEQSPFVKAWTEAEADLPALAAGWVPGTYELCGPKVNGNPERFARHTLVRHADAEEFELTISRNAKIAFDCLGSWLTTILAEGIEGVVWHHPDGRMAKLKGRDFQ